MNLSNDAIFGICQAAAEYQQLLDVMRCFSSGGYGANKLSEQARKAVRISLEKKAAFLLHKIEILVAS